MQLLFARSGINASLGLKVQQRKMINNKQNNDSGDLRPGNAYDTRRNTIISSVHILSLLNMQHLSIPELNNAHNLFYPLILFSGF